jgi:NADH-quinone oxidoreductase subunit J
MTASVIAFYLISAFILTGGILAVTSRKIFRSAVWLLFSLTGIASLYFWMDLQFLAAVQIIVYIGGIVVLIIFSIFLTAQTGADLPHALMWRKGLSAFLALAGFGIVSFIILKSKFLLSTENFDSSISAIGGKMLSTEDGGYALPFEAVSILLLAAMIGCIAIAMKKNPGQS